MHYRLVVLGMWLGIGGAIAAVPGLPPPPDSLRARLRAAPAGTARARVLLRVAQAFASGGEQPDSAGFLGYGRVALALSRQLGDSVLVGQVYDQFGNYYLETGRSAAATVWLRRAQPLLPLAPPAVRAGFEYHLAWLREKQQQPRLAQRHYQRAINLYQQARFPAQEAETTLFLGRLLQDEGQMDSATIYVFRALALYQQVHDTVHITTTLTNVASLLTQREELADANQYLKQAYRLAQHAHDPPELISILNGLALNAERADSLPLYYRYMGLQLLLSRRAGLPLQSQQLGYLGHEFKRRQQPDSAIFYFLKSIRLAQRDGTSHMVLGRMMSNLAQYYQQQGQAAPAATWAQHALALRTPIPAENYAVYALMVLGKQAQARQDYRMAYQLLRQEAKLRAAVIARRHTNLAEKVRSRYEVDQAEQRVRLLQQDQELARLRRQREWAAGTSLLLLTVGAAGAGTVRYRRRQRQREDALRTRLAADLHDDVGSLLTQISLESSWLRSSSRSPEQLAPHLDHLAEASRRAVQQLSDVVWGIDARNDDTGRVLEHMRDHAHEVLSIVNLEVDFAADPAVAALPLPQLTRQNLYLIYKEALHNVVKHAQATLVTVRLRHEGSQLLLLLHDDGCGYTGTGRPGGQGLRNMQARARAVGGTVSYEPQNPGFGVVVRLPL